MKLFDRFLLGKPEVMLTRPEFRRKLTRPYINFLCLFLSSLAGLYWAERNDRPDISLLIALASVIPFLYIYRGINATARLRSAFPGLTFKNPILEIALSISPLTYALLIAYLSRVETGGPRAQLLFGRGRSLLYGIATLPLLMPMAWIVFSLNAEESNLRMAPIGRLLLSPTNQQIVLLGDEILDASLVSSKAPAAASQQFLSAANSLRPSSTGVILLSARAVKPFGRSPANNSAEDTQRLAKGIVTAITNKEPDSGFARFAFISLLSPPAFFEGQMVRAVLAPIEFAFSEKYLAAAETLFAKIEKRSPEAKREVASLRAEVKDSRFTRRMEAMKNSPFRFW
ncbi:MAG: hypothetical protein EOP11_08780 [Proteobacteria bacterium]|nr:MAG: hypothetical protein EOP11_08780 [Pseudomonadota bacterium]